MPSDPLAGARSMPRDLLRQLVYLPAGERLRRRSAARGGRRRGPRAPAVGPSRRLRRHDRPPGRRSGARRRPRHRRAAGGGPPIGAQQGLHHRRGRTARRPGGAGPLGAAWASAKPVRASERSVAAADRPRAHQSELIRDAELRRSRRPVAHQLKESMWARTSPSSWTWRTSSTRPRRPAWTSTTSRCSSRPPPDATSSARTHIPGWTRTTRTSATSTTSCARHDYKVVSKDIRKYGDGKVKANLDIELVVDMMKTARNLDVAIVVSGDGDFAPAIRAVQEMGVRVEVISFRGNTSLATSSRSPTCSPTSPRSPRSRRARRGPGRRVADDDEDLSMTEVPDKQTEGTGDARPRPRSRSRPARARPRSRPSNGRRRTSRAAAEPTIASANGGGSLIALPGEKLSRVGATTPIEEGLDDEEVAAEEETFESAGPIEEGAESEEGARRRRRRRGGRGRGRGRGRAEEGLEGEPIPASEPASADENEDFEDEEPAAPRRPQTTPFGSFWDSQLGVPTAASGAARPTIGPVDEEDFEEPEIPEYLIAEQRRGRQGAGPGQGRGGGNRGGPRGGRSAYTAAVERERYGGVSRSPGFNRYPDVSGRDRQGGGGGRPSGGNRQGGFRQDRPERSERPPRTSGGDPWSEVPPELEEMLRAQLAQSGKARPTAPTGQPRRAPAEQAAETDQLTGAAPGDAFGEEPAKPAARRRTTRRAPTATTEPGSGAATAEAATSEASGGSEASDDAADVRDGLGHGRDREHPTSADEMAEPATPKRRTTRRAARLRRRRPRSPRMPTRRLRSDGPPGRRPSPPERRLVDRSGRCRGRRRHCPR